MHNLLMYALFGEPIKVINIYNNNNKIKSTNRVQKNKMQTNYYLLFVVVDFARMKITEQ